MNPKIILFAVLIFFLGVHSPCVVKAQTFELYHGKDTINRTDAAGQKQGKWIVFNKDSLNPEIPYNAVMEELFYKEGKREGMRKVYFNNGKLKSEVLYKNNRPSGNAKFYYPNGKLAEEGNWIYGGWDGKYKNYYETGPLSEDLQYSYGKKDGPQKQYHPNGKLKLEGVWKGGVPDGIVREFNEDGELISETNYVNGEVSETGTKRFSGNPDAASNPIVQEQLDSVGVFTGTGFYRFKNKWGLVSREGMFSNGTMMDGKYYYYEKDKKLSKTVVYKDGRIEKVLEEK